MSITSTGVGQMSGKAVVAGEQSGEPVTHCCSVNSRLLASSLTSTLAAGHHGHRPVWQPPPAWLDLAVFSLKARRGRRLAGRPSRPRGPLWRPANRATGPLHCLSLLF